MKFIFFSFVGNHIRSCMPRGKEVTIYDIANQLNISIATVSRALKDDLVVSKKTKKRIFETAERLGYRSNHFASNLRKQQTIIRGSSLRSPGRS
ncbi:MAG: hypothetical protein BGO55_04965 [Sphingobacteriales bacterium 50-39]|nr:MAG: hypothetical protein BGO55_04965 [Sphingobacteriales bacterium 50-39]